MAIRFPYHPEISYRIQKEGFDLDAPIRRITAADARCTMRPTWFAAYLPDVPRTVKLVKEVMYLKNNSGHLSFNI